MRERLYPSSLLAGGCTRSSAVALAVRASSPAPRLSASKLAVLGRCRASTSATKRLVPWLCREMRQLPGMPSATSAPGVGSVGSLPAAASRAGTESLARKQSNAAGSDGQACTSSALLLRALVGESRCVWGWQVASSVEGAQSVPRRLRTGVATGRRLGTSRGKALHPRVGEERAELLVLASAVRGRLQPGLALRLPWEAGVPHTARLSLAPATALRRLWAECDTRKANLCTPSFRREGEGVVAASVCAASSQSPPQHAGVRPATGDARRGVASSPASSARGGSGRAGCDSSASWGAVPRGPWWAARHSRWAMALPRAMCGVNPPTTEPAGSSSPLLRTLPRRGEGAEEDGAKDGRQGPCRARLRVRWKPSSARGAEGGRRVPSAPRLSTCRGRAGAAVSASACDCAASRAAGCLRAPREARARARCREACRRDRGEYGCRSGAGRLRGWRRGRADSICPSELAEAEGFNSAPWRPVRRGSGLAAFACRCLSSN